MVEQTQFAVDDADLCLFVVDGKLGLNNDDFYFADWLRKIKKPTILIANKCENLNEEIFSKEYYKLGFGKPTGVSAEHKLGLGDLYDKIAPEIEKYEEMFAELSAEKKDSVEDENFAEESDEINDLESDVEDKEHQFQIAVIGKPNAGKSSFLNKILGNERFITGAEAGITRDAIAVDFEYKNQKIRFIDTAGIRKKSAIHQKLEDEPASKFDAREVLDRVPSFQAEKHELSHVAPDQIEPAGVNETRNSFDAIHNDV
jgi:GTP-binding protein